MAPLPAAVSMYWSSLAATVLKQYLHSHQPISDPPHEPRAGAEQPSPAAPQECMDQEALHQAGHQQHASVRRLIDSNDTDGERGRVAVGEVCTATGASAAPEPIMLSLRANHSSLVPAACSRRPYQSGKGTGMIYVEKKVPCQTQLIRNTCRKRFLRHQNQTTVTLFRRGLQQLPHFHETLMQ